MLYKNAGKWNFLKIPILKIEIDWKTQQYWQTMCSIHSWSWLSYDFDNMILADLARTTNISFSFKTILNSENIFWIKFESSKHCKKIHGLQ